MLNVNKPALVRLSKRKKLKVARNIVLLSVIKFTMYNRESFLGKCSLGEPNECVGFQVNEV